MSTSLLKGNRTRYRNLLEKEFEKGKGLLREADVESYELKVFLKNVNNWARLINDFIKQLEQANVGLSVGVDGQDGAQEVEEQIKEDWSYISEVTDCRGELVDIQHLLQDQKSPLEILSSVTVIEDRLNHMIYLTARMQQVLIGQQQLQQQQQQVQMEQSSSRHASIDTSV